MLNSKGGSRFTRTSTRWAGNGRTPAEKVASKFAAPQAHASRRQHRVRKGAVMNLHQVDAVAQAASQRALANRPIVRRGQAQVLVADCKAVEPHIIDDIGEGPDFVACHVK